MNNESIYNAKHDKLIVERNQAIHRASYEHRANSPETKIACQDAWNEYNIRKRELRLYYGLPVDPVEVKR